MISTFALSVFEALVLGLNLFVPTLARRLPVERRPMLGLGLVAGLLAAAILRVVTSDGGDASAAGFGFHSRAATIVLVCLGALLCADLLAGVGGAKLEPSGWWLIAVFGAGGALAAAWVVEILTRGPAAGSVATIIASFARLLLMLALAEATIKLPPRWSVAAGALAGPAVWLGLPPLVQHHAVALGALPALIAGSVLMILAPFLPPRLRRGAALIGVLAAWLAVAAIGTAWHQGRLVLDTFPLVEQSL